MQTVQEFPKTQTLDPGAGPLAGRPASLGGPLILEKSQ